MRRPRRRSIGDGGNWIKIIGGDALSRMGAGLDFLHLLVHLYAAVTAAYRGDAKAVPKRSYGFAPPISARTIGRSGSTNNALVAGPPAGIAKSSPHKQSCTPRDFLP